MLTGVRTQELRFARWEDIDFGDKIVGDPGRSNEDEARPHIVPLSERVIMLFKQLRQSQNIIPQSLSVENPANQLVRSINK